MERAILSPASSVTIFTPHQHGTVASSLKGKGTVPLVNVASRMLADDCGHGGRHNCKVAASMGPTVPNPPSGGFHYRRLPWHPIELITSEGEKLFYEAVKENTWMSFLPVISCYNLHDPETVWEGKIWAQRASESNINTFRSFVSLCTSIKNYHLVVSYDRKRQSGDNNFSPIGAYHAGNDMVLVMEVGREKYLPHWVPLNCLWREMNTIDELAQNHNEFMIVSTYNYDKEPSMLYSKIYGHKGWNMLLLYMIKDFPLLLDAGYVTDMEKVLSVAFDTPPIGHNVLIPWVAEVGSQEDGHVLQDDLLMEIRETKLFGYVSTWLETKFGNGLQFVNFNPDQNGYIGMHRSTGDVLTLLLCGLPQVIWSHIKEKNLREEITNLVSVSEFPLLEEEVMNLRRELEFLMIDLLSGSIMKSNNGQF